MKPWVIAVIAGSVVCSSISALELAKPTPGELLWTNAVDCKNCHGEVGQGGFGPALAGDNLPVAGFTAYVRHPLGSMPAFSETEISDQELADIKAYLGGLSVDRSARKPRFSLPADAPAGQRFQLAKVGCGQCHGVNLDVPRAYIGGMGQDRNWFYAMIYDHENAMAQLYKTSNLPPKQRLQMGSYSVARLPKADADKIWDWAAAAGFRPLIVGKWAPPVTVKGGVKYTLNLANNGMPAVGLGATGLTIGLDIPMDATVVEAAGPGYLGTRDGNGTAGKKAEWNIAALQPAQRETFSLILAQEAKLSGSVEWTGPKVADRQVDRIVLAAAPMLKPAGNIIEPGSSVRRTK